VVLLFLFLIKNNKFFMFSPEHFGFRGLKSYLFYGDKGNGKSMFTSYLLDWLLDTYEFQEKKFPNLPHRQVYSNQKFTQEVEDLELHKHLEYWSSPKQLYNLRNTDIIWDEIGKDLPAVSWKDCPKPLRQVFSHLRKRGNRLFSNTQVYNDIDVSFRRQVDRTFRMVKALGSPDISASLPPVRVPWGFIVMYEMDKNSLETQDNLDKQKQRGKILQLPKFLLIRRKWVSMYDTSAEIPAYRPTELEHNVFTCFKEGCNKVHIEHVKA
jgi:hypothetical protein